MVIKLASAPSLLPRKAIWLALLIATITVSFIDAISFGLRIFDEKFGRAQIIVLTLVAIALAATVIWGRRVVVCEVTTDVPTLNTDTSSDN